MPELPEVETVARGLHRHVAGDAIVSVWLGSKPEPLKSPAAEIVRTLEGSRIERVRRVGKHIVFDLAAVNSKTKTGDMLADGGKSKIKPGTRRQWVVHLGMTGRMTVNDPNAVIEKHTHAIVKLASGRELRFVDPRRFGRLAVVNGDFTGPGAEPLGIGLQEFTRLFHASKAPIKSALLNQRLLHGVGNIYADESLFHAGIRPRRRANTLTRMELDRLHAAVEKVLTHAIALGGSSVSDYVNAEGERGFFQVEHHVYMRTGEPCLVCGSPIKRVVLAGRSSHYCSKCQK